MEDQPEYQTLHSNKRLKRSEAIEAAQRGSFSNAAAPVKESTKPITGASKVELSTPILPPELYHIQAKYDFTTMSIISSSRIEQKVRSLLSHLQKFSFADVKAKPGVVALHAKASVAKKLISIVEITKKCIKEEGGKWWQYSRLHGDLTELKEKPRKEKDEGKTLLEWEKTQATEVVAKPSKSDGENVDSMMDIDEAVDEDEEEVAFETMNENKQTTNHAVLPQAEPRKKLRAVPVMTIYMSRVPIIEFRELYGEQTNG